MRLFLVAVAGVVLSLTACSDPGPPRSISGCEVVEKDRTTKDDDDGGGSDHRVYTTGPGECSSDVGTATFKVEDVTSGEYRRTNSADVFGSIQPGKTYTFIVLGERNSERSEFPNILRAVEEG